MAQHRARKGVRVYGGRGVVVLGVRISQLGGSHTWTPPPPAGGTPGSPRVPRWPRPRLARGLRVPSRRAAVLCRGWTGGRSPQTSRNCRGALPPAAGCSRPPQSYRAPGPRPADYSSGRSSPREGGSPGTGPLTSLSFSPPPKPRPREELVGGRSGGDGLPGRGQRTSPLSSAGGRRGAAPRVPVGLREPVAAGGSRGGRGRRHQRREQRGFLR